MNSPQIVRITDPRITEASPQVGVYTSLEGRNPGGSIKDHMVYGELKELLDQGRLKPGDLVSEISAGSTALSLAHYTRILGLRFVVFLPVNAPSDLLEQIRHQGAEIRQVELATAFEEYRQYVDTHKVWDFNQTFDTSKRRHYTGLAKIIENRVGHLNILVGSVGTGHSLLGIAGGLSKRPLVVSVEPQPGDKVSGVRNIETDSLGDSDPCPPSLFDQRIVIAKNEYFPDGPIETDAGMIRFNQSFQLVLSGLKKVKSNFGARRIFLVGAKNTEST